jgi:hypothetical protein
MRVSSVVKGAEGSRATVGGMAKLLERLVELGPPGRPATTTGAAAVGALALGAAAVGGFAIGRLSVGRLAVGRAKVGRLEIAELDIRRLSLPHPPDDQGNRD